MATIRITVEGRNAESTLRRIRSAVDQTDRSFGRVTKSTGLFSLATQRLGTILSGLGFGYMTKQIIDMADSYKLLSGQIAVVTNSNRELMAAQSELFNISQRTRTELEATTKLYTSLDMSLERMGKSQADALKTTELVNKAIAISGSSVMEAAASVTQLGQAFASGKLQGDELRSLMENAKGLTKAIADGMGVAVGSLKTLGEEGKITANVLYDALQKSADSISDKFSKIPLTVGQSLTQVSNSITLLIGDADRVLGGTDGLAGTFSKISKFISDNRFEIIEFGRDVYRVFQLMGTGIIAVGNTVEIAMLEATKFIGDSINWIADGWDAMTVGLKNVFKKAIDFIGESFYSGINYMLGLVEDYIKGVGSIIDKIPGVDNPFKSINLSIGEYKSVIEEAKRNTEDLINLDWTKSNLEEAYATQNKILKATSELWDDIAKNTTKASKVFSPSTIGSKPTEINNAELSKEAKKAAKTAQKEWDKALDHVKGQAKEMGDQLEYEAKRFTDSIRSGFYSLLNGDLSNAVGSFFGDSITKLTEDIGGLFGGIVGGVLDFGIGLLNGLFSSEAPPPPVLEDIAKTSDSMANSLAHIEDAQYPMLQLTRDMKGYLSIIANSFGAIENSLLRSNIDFSGAFYKPTTKSGAMGLSSKDYSLFGTTLDFEAATIAEIMAEDLRVVSNTIIKKVYDSFWKTKTTYFDNYKNVSSLFAEDIADATTALFSGFTAIGDAIGVSMDGLLNEVIDIGLINTTGKSDAAIAAEIEARFSAQTDAIAEQYLSVVAEFQRAGEGLAETAFRVALTFDQVSHSMELIGKTVDWRTANIIEMAAGGLDNLSRGMNTYMENFFTESEQYEMKLSTMTKSFASLGLALPDSIHDFRSLVSSIDTMSDEGAALFAEVMSLTDGFVDLKGSMSDIIGMIEEVSDAWLGNLSYLTLQQKADFASGYLSIAGSSNGAIDTVEAARLAAETALKTTATKEEYIPIFERYIAELEGQTADATNTDLLNELRALKAEVVELRQAATDAAIFAGTNG
ncbi:tape measure protein [Sulfurovum sp. XTW-4]|uniref:Tape measure protein n=1 Tax=Sulfurovum xiamenensis TaxID=3019066 RepID=A0ABT7QUB4_9BACT|nr:tape measure protein [Sulfurovum xiamenensis]MDM5264677.1 tape measure protein [Sulfurovum xiamenensis]